MIRVRLPAPLQTLAGIEGEVRLALEGPATLTGVLTALEHRYPMLCGTLRDPVSGQRRPLVRFFACGEDWSLAAPGDALPEAVTAGSEPLLVVGAIAGG